jgi:hypothetical protein
MKNALVISRVTVMALVVSALIATLTDTSGLVPSTFSEIATYFTFQANVIALAVWGALIFYSRRGGVRPRWLEYGRAFTAANLVTVAILYWVAIAPLGLQNGGQLIYVMVISHIISPLYATAEQLLVGPRSTLPWRHIWMIAGYASVWVTVAVVRSIMGGPVIYDYLDPELGWRAIAFALTWNFAVLVTCSAAAMRIRRWRRWSEDTVMRRLMRADDSDPS